MADSHVFFGHSNRLVAERGEGVYLYDTDNKRYLDAIGGTHVISIGHGVTEIGEAMAEAANKLNFVHKVVFTSKPQEELADMIIDMAPEGMEKVAFVNSGSVANEMAVQLAKYYHQARGNTDKYKVIARWHSYHGRTMTSLALSGSLFVQRGEMSAYAPDFPRIQAPHCYQCPLKMTYPSCQLACADELERAIEQEGPETVSAFIAEPIIGGAGSAIVPPPGYYERIREICDAYDVLFISEEIVTGFGRTGKPFGIQHWDAVPDMITATKGLSSGYAPIGAVIVHEKMWNAFVENNRTNIPAWVTYSGHPISCAAAIAVQKYIVEHDLITQCADRGEYLKGKLEALAQRETLIGDVRGKGLMIGLEFVADRESHEPFPRSVHLTENILRTALENGLILRGRFGTSTGKNGDHLLLSPPFVITEEECDELVMKLESTIQQVKQTLNLG